ncbi:MAG: permease-like cell division protein FtsX, partial [Armatimonadota bacterium]
MATLLFLVREAFINLRRHGMMTAAAVSTLAAALVLCGGFVLGAARVVTIARRQVDAFEMRVFCRAESSPVAMAEIRSRLVALPGVRKVDFIPREQAFEEQARGLPIDTDGVPNLFPHTYVVRFDAPETAKRTADLVRGWHGDVEGVDVRERELDMALRIAG